MSLTTFEWDQIKGIVIAYIKTKLPLASISRFGIVKTSVPPLFENEPIVVGTNDPRLTAYPIALS